MTVEQAQSAVSLSAFTVAAVFAYRKLTEPVTHNAPATGHFVMGFGFVYVALSLVAQAAPDIGGMMAILVAVGDLLGNGQQLVKDLTGGLQQTAQATGSKPAAH